MNVEAPLRRYMTVAIVGSVLLGARPGVSAAGETLQPYQLVRSLQLVQDRIAAGDHAALPMQGKLLEMVDARLRTATPDVFKEPRNFRALMVYGMSGGNPTTVKVAASRLELDASSHAIAGAVIDYLNGRPSAAIAGLAAIDPMQLPSDLGAFLALVKGSLLAADQPVEALALLDKARLLSPGTLVEEAALRRSVAIAINQGDASRFALASTQYARRFLYSPYASQFADAFVAGVIALYEVVGQDRVVGITSMMDPEREKVIYLRIARRAAIEGLKDLSAFASARAERGRDGDTDDPRALLYASLSTVTSATVEDVRAKLDAIDRSRLSESDQQLFDAAKAIARGMTALPKITAVAAPVPPAKIVKTIPPSAPEADAASETDLPPVEGVMPPAPDANTAEAHIPAPIAFEKAARTEADPSDPTDTAIADARRKLGSVDQMLGASPQ